MVVVLWRYHASCSETCITILAAMLIYCLFRCCILCFILFVCFLFGFVFVYIYIYIYIFVFLPLFHSELQLQGFSRKIDIVRYFIREETDVEP